LNVKKILDMVSAEAALGCAIGGVIITAFTAGEARLKADDILANIEDDRYEIGINEPMSTQEKLKETWKCYILPAISCGATIGFMIWSHQIQGRKLVALASAYALTNHSFKEYRNKAKELLSQKKFGEIEHSIAQDKVSDMTMLDGDILATNRGDVLCFDYWTGMKFFSNATEIREAVSRCNNMLADSVYLSLATLYDEIGIPIITTTAGKCIPANAEYLGWNRLRDGSIKVRTDVCKDKEDIPTLVMILEPKPDAMFEDC